MAARLKSMRASMPPAMLARSDRLRLIDADQLR